jgi:hypothetical protein
MPSTLTKFLAWLIDDKSFEKANEPHVMSKEKLRKVLGLVESIVSVARCTFTSFHLGLAIELYHEYGSRTYVSLPSIVSVLRSILSAPSCIKPPPSCTEMIPSGAKAPFFHVLHFMHSYACKIAPNFGI